MSQQLIINPPPHLTFIDAATNEVLVELSHLSPSWSILVTGTPSKIIYSDATTGETLATSAGGHFVPREKESISLLDSDGTVLMEGTVESIRHQFVRAPFRSRGLTQEVTVWIEPSRTFQRLRDQQDQAPSPT